MKPAEIERQRRNREEAVKIAWQRLATNPDFETVWTKDLQAKFPPLGASFRDDEGWNPIPAAKRDGQRSVISHIARRLGIAIAIEEEEYKEPPKEAESEFQGMKP